MFKFMVQAARGLLVSPIKEAALSGQALTGTESALSVQPAQAVRSSKSVCAISETSKQEVVTVTAGQLIPFDGKIIEGVALVDESALVGVSTPALLSDEQGRNNVIEGTQVVEGTLKIVRA